MRHTADDQQAMQTQEAEHRAQQAILGALIESTRKPNGEIDLFAVAAALSKAHVNNAKDIDHG